MLKSIIRANETVFRPLLVSSECFVANIMPSESDELGDSERGTASGIWTKTKDEQRSESGAEDSFGAL